MYHPMYHVHSIVQYLFLRGNAIFQDDNALIHTSSIVQDWFYEHQAASGLVLTVIRSKYYLDFADYFWKSIHYRYPLLLSLPELVSILQEESYKILENYTGSVFVQSKTTATCFGCLWFSCIVLENIVSFL